MRFVKQIKFNQERIILLAIIIFALMLRLYGLNWDQGFHLHPDERAIVMFTTPLQFPKNLDEFLSPQSPLNPNFFAYGNFPLYLLKAVASILANFDPLYALYEKINLVGRGISAIADVGTLILIFLIGKKLFNKDIGLLAAFFYAVSVFSIQTAHFYAVDTLLTFFIILTLYQLIRFYDKPSVQNSILIGVFFGLSLATKVSAIPLVIAVITTIAVDFILIIIKQPHRPHIWFPHVPRFLKRVIVDGVIIAIATGITFTILQPYAVIDFQEFLKQNLLQSQMTRDAFTFPYTLQYVGKTPYLYEIKNVFLWGQGPILATLSFLGIIYVTFRLIRKHLGWWRGNDLDSSEVDGHLRGVHSATSKVQIAQELILLIFFWVYLLIVGKFAVGFMRYMLPLYPLLALFAAILFLKISHLSIKVFKPSLYFIFYILFLILLIVWPLSFMHIYTKPNTRVLASEWIYQNIPADKTIAREHWDDGMPIGGNIAYKTLELPIYEMQDPLRETQIYQTIQEADYIVIASNRLYVPLQRISKNCQKWNLPKERCAKNANRYYEKLFSGELGYKKVAEFENPPTIPIFNIQINDQTADESFTVYDHPKVMIFKKVLF